MVRPKQLLEPIGTVHILIRFDNHPVTFCRQRELLTITREQLDLRGPISSTSSANPPRSGVSYTCMSYPSIMDSEP